MDANSDQVFGTSLALLTTQVACHRLSIGRTKLYELINSGQIAVVRLGKRTVRIPVSEVERIAGSGHRG